MLLIDEAHLLHQDVLHHLHILANYEWDSKPLLSLVLVGLPEIRQRLTLARNRSLYSRVHTRISLGEATATDTAEYVGYRMKRAGAEREVFNADAISIIHEHAQGRLRDIDRICTDALKLAAKKKARSVDRASVAHVIRARPRRRRRRLTGITSAARPRSSSMAITCRRPRRHAAMAIALLRTRNPELRCPSRSLPAVPPATLLVNTRRPHRARLEQRREEGRRDARPGASTSCARRSTPAYADFKHRRSSSPPRERVLWPASRPACGGKRCGRHAARRSPRPRDRPSARGDGDLFARRLQSTRRIRGCAVPSSPRPCAVPYRLLSDSIVDERP